MIGALLRWCGIPQILIYILLVVAVAGLIFGYGALEYSKGKSAGTATERAAWVAQREEDKAKQLAKAASDQRRIDQIEADNLALQSQLAETQNALEEAIHAEGSDQKPALPKALSKALNGVGR